MPEPLNARDPLSYWFIIDRDFRVASSSAPQLSGIMLFEEHPDTEAECRPWHEYVFETGQPVEFRTFYRGVVWHIRSEPCAGDVRVETQAVTDPVTVEDFTSLRSLTEVVLRAADALEAFGPACPAPVVASRRTPGARRRSSSRLRAV